MLDRIAKIATIAASALVIVIAIIGGVLFVARPDADITRLDADIARLDAEVAGLRRDMDEVKANQRQILDGLQRLEVALVNHTHDSEGQAWFPAFPP